MQSSLRCLKIPALRSFQEFWSRYNPHTTPGSDLPVVTGEAYLQLSSRGTNIISTLLVDMYKFPDLEQPSTFVLWKRPKLLLKKWQNIIIIQSKTLAIGTSYKKHTHSEARTLPADLEIISIIFQAWSIPALHSKNIIRYMKAKTYPLLFRGGVFAAELLNPSYRQSLEFIAKEPSIRPWLGKPQRYNVFELE